ncbi:uncharacterized protein LOC134182250 [Corticium candelabrum]|uniref:uncharacterized protein LOC134182250 n=1 Tax=Corticium candelabrum TaxID=121492 RepID=UPI002E26CC2B|nr:uncharacterized protein LOC134182250 [Corticium candelabrum]
MATAKEKQEDLQIEEHLMHDGVRPDVSDDRKIRHLYRKVLRTETTLRETIQGMDALKTQQAEEMQAVEGYVEHIRNLSGEKDQLVAELERENDVLKEELMNVHVEKSANVREAESIAELLSAEGMQEFAKGSAREQVSNLLTERARMLSDLTAGELKVQQLQTDVTTAEKKAGKEKRDYEQSMRKVQEQTEEEKAKLKTQHEEAKKVLVTERDKQKREAQALGRKLAAAEKEVRVLTARIAEEEKKRLKEVQEVKDRHRSDLQATKSNHEKTIRKVSEDRDSHSQRITQLSDKCLKLEQENASLNETVSRLRNDLSDEREKRRSFGVTQGEQVARLTGENHQLTEQLSQTQAQLESETQERNELDTRLSLVRKELGTSKDTELLLSTELEDFKVESARAKTQYENTIEDLSRECSSLQAQLQARTESIQQHTASAEELRAELVRMEGQIDEERERAESTKDRLETEIGNLKGKLQSTAVSSLQEKSEMEDANRELKELLSASKAKLERLQSDLAARIKQHSTSEHHADSLSTEVRRLQEELEGVLSERVVQDQEYSNQMTILQAERERLAHDLASTSANLQEQMERADELHTQLDLITEQNTNLEQKTAIFANEIDQLKHTNREVQTSLNESEETVANLNSELTILKESHSESQDENSLLRREVEQLRINNKQLAKQARESQATYETNSQEMEDEWNRQKCQLTSENTRITNQLKISVDEAKQLHESLALQKRELDKATKELMSLRETVSTLDASLFEERTKTHDLELVSTKRDGDMERFLTQLQEQVEQITGLDVANKSLKSNLERKSEECRQLTAELDEERVNHEAAKGDRDKAQSSLSQAEEKINELMSELSQAVTTRDDLQHEVQSMAATKDDYGTQREQVEMLRSQLQHEQLERAQSQQIASDLRAKLDCAQENDVSSRSTLQLLQHRVSELESSLTTQKQKYKRLQEKYRQSEAANTSIREEITALFSQSEVQKTELALLSEEVDLQGQRYFEGKRRRSEKYISAREKHERERRSLESSVVSLQDELDSATRRLIKENEWRSRAEEMHRQLLREKQQLVETLAAVEDREREKAHNARQLEVHVVRLEQENTALQDRLQRVLKDKARMESLLRDTSSPDMSLHSLVSSRKSSTQNGFLSDTKGPLRTSSPYKFSPFSSTLGMPHDPSDR